VVDEANRIQGQLQKVTSHLWDTLEQARIGSHFDPVRVDRLVEEVLSVVGQQFKREGIVVETEFPQVPALLLNRAKLRGVFQCLLENAREAIARKGSSGRISLSAERRDDRLLLVIADDGAGIAPEITPKIFYQGFSTKAEGRGLGLHYSILAVEDMGGSIAVESDGPNHGTTVRLAFPYT